MAPADRFTLPDRFQSATFEGYEPRTAGQAEALRAARRFAEAQRRPLSWTDRIKEFVGIADAGPKGLYLVGPAGTGKTHLLAAAYNALTPEVPCAFLHSSELFRRTEPPAAFARRLGGEYAVCCLDEVEIDDPANEMRLAGTMRTLAEQGVPLLATSNVKPEESLSGQFGTGRFHRFLRREFRARYQIVSVEGEDYRRTQNVQQSGHGWIGPPERTRLAMTQAWAAAVGASRWWTFADLRRATTDTAHTNLIDTLTTLDHLFVENVAIENTDDALRLLRVVDALYLHAEAPALYFTAERPPEDWFDPDDHGGVARAVAEKFDRTVSRLHALCRIRAVEQDTATPS